MAEGLRPESGKTGWGLEPTDAKKATEMALSQCGSRDERSQIVTPRSELDAGNHPPISVDSPH